MIPIYVLVYHLIMCTRYPDDRETITIQVYIYEVWIYTKIDLGECSGVLGGLAEMRTLHKLSSDLIIIYTAVPVPSGVRYGTWNDSE